VRKKMRSLIIAIFIFSIGCSNCGGNNKLDSDTEDMKFDDGIYDTKDFIEDEKFDTGLENVLVDDGNSVDQLAMDCFSPLDAPYYDVSFLWTKIEPDREPMPCEGCCRQVTFGPDDDWFHFDVWGRYVIYNSCYQLPPIEFTRCEIRFKNVDERTEYVVEKAREWPIFRHPAIYEDKFVYGREYLLSSDTLRCEIIKGSITEGTKEVIFTYDYPYGNPDDSYWCPGGWSPIDLYGRYAVYESNRSGLGAGQQIYLLDIETGEERKISLGEGGVGFPRIWKNLVVYFGFYEGPDIYLYNIDTGETENLTKRPDHLNTREGFPAIWENIVALRHGPPEMDDDAWADIYMMDLNIRELIPVCLNPAGIMWAIDIYDDLIAWTDLRNDPCPNFECRTTNTDIYYYRISNGTEHRGSFKTGNEYSPHIWQNRIFFEMKDSANLGNVFMIEAQ